jgi:hypothetical protein
MVGFWYSFRNDDENLRAMYKMQIFQEALDAVMEEMEIDRAQILSNSKEEEVIDARSTLVRIMHEKGLYPIQISRLTGICIRSVNRFLGAFKERCDSRPIMRINYGNIKAKVGLMPDNTPS